MLVHPADLLRIYFISFGTSKGTSSSAPTRTDVWNPAQQELWKNYLSPLAKKYLGANGTDGEPVPSYPGQLFVPQTEQETQFMGAANTLVGSLPSRQAALDQVLSGRPAYEINPDVTANYFEESIRPLAMREFRETTMPQIKESFAGPGYWGTPRMEAESRAGEHLAENLAAAKANLVYQDEQARRASLEQAATRQTQGALSPTDAVTSAIQGLGSAGAYSRQIAQEKVTADLQRWLMGETVDGIAPEQFNPFLQYALALMGLNQYAVGTTSQSQNTSWGGAVSWNVGGGSNTGDTGDQRYVFDSEEAFFTYLESIEGRK